MARCNSHTFDMSNCYPTACPLSYACKIIATMDPALFACEMWSLEHWTRAPEAYTHVDQEAIEDFTHKNRNSHWWRNLVYYSSSMQYEQLYRNMAASSVSHAKNLLFLSLLQTLYTERGNEVALADILAWYRMKGFKFPKFPIETK